MSFAKPGNILPRLTGGKEKYTDTNEFLSPGVLIAYKKRADHVIYPSLATKTAVNEAAIQARNIIRVANDVMAKVCLLRQKEPAYFTATMERHFNLIAGNNAGGWLKDNTVDKAFSPKDIITHDRRWALDKIRRNMLSLSFHLNTGMYLIDSDRVNRTVSGGDTVPAGSANPASEEAYVFQYAEDKTFHLCGFRNGEIHLDFLRFRLYSRNSAARVIIHEAAHKFLNVDDKFYAHSPNYPPSTKDAITDNADSYAWAAVSLATQSVKMPTNSKDPDWKACPGPKI